MICLLSGQGQGQMSQKRLELAVRKGDFRQFACRRVTDCARIGAVTVDLALLLAPASARPCGTPNPPRLM